MTLHCEGRAWRTWSWGTSGAFGVLASCDRRCEASVDESTRNPRVVHICRSSCSSSRPFHVYPHTFARVVGDKLSLHFAAHQSNANVSTICFRMLPPCSWHELVPSFSCCRFSCHVISHPNVHIFHRFPFDFTAFDSIPSVHMDTMKNNLIMRNSYYI